MLPNILNTFSDSIKTSFSVSLPGSGEIRIGKKYGDSEFKVMINNQKGVRALISRNELVISEAYIRRDIDLTDGIDMLKIMKIINSFRKKYSFFERVSRWIDLFASQVKLNRNNIKIHYEFDDDFYLYFLDRTRAYSHGIFENDQESLETANLRKLEFGMKSCRLSAGSRVLDIGGGWGCAVEYLGSRNIHVDSLTISKRSFDFVSRIIQYNNLSNCKIINADFLNYKIDACYDAIFSLGTLEHLPDYSRVLSRCDALLRPGGYAYFDASATASTEIVNSQFINKHIFPGNHQCLNIHKFLETVKNSNFEIHSLHNDTYNYFLTLKSWGNNLDSNRDVIIKRWGAELYRKFQLYFWGCCYGMMENKLQAYRIVLRKKT